MKRWGLAAVVLGLAIEPAGAAEPPAGRRATIQGSVTDLESRAPLAAAVVRLVDLGCQAITDVQGRYRLDDIPPGPQHVVARRMITEAQFHVSDSVYFNKLNNAFGVTSKAMDWAPEVGCMVSFGGWAARRPMAGSRLGRRARCERRCRVRQGSERGGSVSQTAQVGEPVGHWTPCEFTQPATEPVPPAARSRSSAVSRRIVSRYSPSLDALLIRISFDRRRHPQRPGRR